MNFKTTTILLLVLVLLVGTVAIVKYREAKDTDTKGVDEKRLVKLEAGDVSKLVITPRDGARIVFEKAGTADWRLAEPVAAPAQGFTVQGLVDALIGIRARDTIELAKAGLDSPAFVVELHSAKAAKPTVLKIGSRQTVGDTSCVQVDGAEMASIVSAGFFDQLDKPAGDFRQTRLINLLNSEVKQVRITREGRTIALERKGEEWKLTGPEAMAAEAGEVSGMLSAITSLNAAAFVGESEITANLRPASNPRATIWLSTSEASTRPTSQPTGGVTILVGGYDGLQKRNVYLSVSDPPSLAKVPASLVESISKQPLDLRDRKILDVEAASVKTVSLTTMTPATTRPTTRVASTTVLSLLRKQKSMAMGPELPGTNPATTQSATAPAQPPLPPTDWTFALDGKSGDAEQAKVDAALGKAHPLRVEKYLAQASATSKPAATHTLTLTTTTASGNSTYEIRLTDAGEDGPLVGEYNGLWFELSRSVLEAFQGDFANKEKAPEPPPMGMPPGFPG